MVDLWKRFAMKMGGSSQAVQEKKPVGAKSDLRKKILSFVEERWDQVPKWFDTLKEKDKLQFMGRASSLPHASTQTSRCYNYV